MLQAALKQTFFKGAQRDLPDAAFRQMVEHMPVNVMLCELDDFRITYINDATRETMRRIEHVLPVRADQLVGTSIDVFHKHPDHQRRMLRDPKNLPHKTRIRVGGEVLDLLVTAINDAQGRYLYPMLTWSLVTEQARIEAETQKLLQMMDNMPVNVMMCDLDFNITYINKTSLNTLTSLQSVLPIPADQVLGANIDVFHKHPEHQRRLLTDPKNLPRRAKISLGDQKLDLRVSALMSPSGDYIGPMVTWSVITGAVKLSEDVKSLVNVMASSATEMQATAQSLAAGAEQTSMQSQAVAAATEELSAAVAEIAGRLNDATSVVSSAVDQTRDSEASVTGLLDSAEKIGAVSSVVAEIASQTNLLALNATIEAARAGEAGRGFAVVATEVKSLANQTAKATSEIGHQVGGIQDSTRSTAAGIQAIARVIAQVNEISASIAGAVEEQAATTREVAANIDGVSQAAEETGRAAGDVLSVAQDLAHRATELEQQINAFIETL
jgi:methyl-accepting chemotaxis protein